MAQIQAGNVHQINTRSIGMVNAEASGDASPNNGSRKSGGVEIVAWNHAQNEAIEQPNDQKSGSSSISLSQVMMNGAGQGN